MMSLNNKIICEPYTGGKGVKAVVSSGFASVKRSQLVGLKVLVDATVLVGTEALNILKGSTIYITEEHLTVHDKYHHPMENAAIGAPFVVAEFAHVVMVE